VASSKFNAVLLFGYPGCGKGTQGAALAGMPNIRHVATGDIFRALDRSSPIGKEVTSYSDKGLLVPDELTIRVLMQHLECRIAAGQLARDYHLLLLDGVPRTPSQVELLHPYIDVLKVVHLKMNDQKKLVDRLKGRAAKSNRPDDAKEEVILRRIKVYEAETWPVLECYASRLIADIEADQPPLAVLRDICAALAPVVPTRI
jgi:adenylate kinase